MRINELAKELEVKAKAILDVLPELGITDKKTHSSSIEDHEAEAVRRHFTAKSGSASMRERPAPPEVKPKIDFSKVHKPGDVARQLKEREEQLHRPVPPPRPPIATAPPAVAPKPPVKPPAVAPPPVQQKPTVIAPKAPVTPAAPVEKTVVVSPPAPKPTAPAAPIAEKAPPAVIVTPPIHQPPVATTAPAAPTKPPAVPPPAPVEQPPIAARPASQQPIVPQRRVITPQTGPRPVYQAPPSAAGAGKPSTAPARPQGVVRGQPIFQRQRPMPGGTGAPAGRPQFGRPGDQRRGPHPTSASRLGFPGRQGVGPGLPPPPAPGKPTGRAGAPARRPGQRYSQGPKEGPMKGFVPPPRLTVSNEPLPITRSITITEGISVKDLAEKLEIRAKDLIARLLMKGVMATVNQTLDFELAKDMANHFGADVEVISFEDQAAKEMAQLAGASEEATAASLVPRPPVVTIMGHVDHGKTSLLDAIRETNVAGGEAGGITQHIGAYKVKITKPDSPAFGREIVFLDTPGHEAFTRMRARGAKVTDIVVLVVAADDGVMPQTLEAMDHAKAAKVPIIVAVNKIDKPEAMPDRVKKQLADRGLMPEDWGGTTVFVDVSAKKRTNLNLLMEMICLVADLQDLKSTPDRAATGVVLEAKLDRGRGPVATVLVQNGTLHASDNFVVGNVFGKVRAMLDDRGNQLEEAPPSTPVEVLGIEGLPQAGDQFVVVADRDKARGVSEFREQKAREAALAKSSRVSLEGLAEQLKTAGTKELNIILKADVGGSVEVLTDLLSKLSNEKVRLKVLRSGVGAITESDVLLASASNAIIIGFNVRPERKAQELAEQEKVDIRLHSIIYELQDEIKRAMTGLLEPTIKETYQGRADVKETFRIPKVGTIAGCQVSDGLVKRDSEVRLLRDNVVVFKGKIGSLRRFKDDASEVRNGMECGIAIANYSDIKVGDVIEAFVTERIAAEVIA